jgi:BASS family bile acid:Na+ symporter
MAWLRKGVVMNLRTLISLAMQTSVFVIVCGLGLKASPKDAAFLFRRPGALARSLLAMNVVMPTVAVVLAASFKFHQAVEIALVALAVSPVPPLLPGKQLKAGGQPSYAIGLLIATAILAIVFVPAMLELLEWAFGNVMYMSISGIAELVAITVLIPLAAGTIVRHLAPERAEQFAGRVSLVGTVLLLVGLVPVLSTALPAVASLWGNGTVAALAVFVLAGLTVGHLLGGPDTYDRRVLALATATRHPGVALAIASTNFPEQKLVQAAVVWYLIVAAILSAVYLGWRRRCDAAEPVMVIK